MKAGKVIYKPVSLLSGALGCAVAGMAFRRLWQTAAHRKPPKATDEDRRWGEILAAAALEGAVFAVVRASADRATATGVRRLTGTWPA